MPLLLYFFGVMAGLIYVASLERQRLKRRLDDLATKYGIERSSIEIEPPLKWVKIRLNAERPDPHLVFEISEIEVQERARYFGRGVIAWAFLAASVLIGAHFHIWT